MSDRQTRNINFEHESAGHPRAGTSKQDPRNQNVDSRQTTMQAKDYAQQAGRDIIKTDTYNNPTNTTVEGSNVKDSIFVNQNVKVEHHHHYPANTPSESAKSDEPKPTNCPQEGVTVHGDQQNLSNANRAGRDNINASQNISFNEQAGKVHFHNYTNPISDSKGGQLDANVRQSLAVQPGPSFLTRALQFFPDKLWQHIQKKKLKKHAQLLSGIRNMPITLENRDQPIQLVPAALAKVISKTIEQLDKEGHYSKREDFQQLLSLETESLDISKAIEQANKRAESDARQHASKEARQDYINRNSNNIVFIGQAGIGKTTLTRMIVEMVLEQKLFPKCEYIFFVFCREIDFNTKTTLLQMCFNGTDIKFRHGQTTEKALMKSIGDGENVVFVCDGLDEANSDALFADELLPSDEIATADVHLKRLFKAKVWKKSKKVLTSRPGQFYLMTNIIQTTSVFNLRGISAASQKKICEQICETAEQVTLVMTYLERKRDIAVLCHVPVLCIIIMYVINKNFAEGKELEIESLTFIFFKVLEYFCQSEHIREKHSYLSKIALLAWNGFKKRNLIFTAKNFRDVGMDQSDADAFLKHFRDDRYKVSVKILEGSERTSFTHLLWQENFSALHLVFFSTLGELVNILPKLTESRWEVVSRFMFGYFNIVLNSTVSSFFTQFGCKPNHQICAVKRSKLVEFAVQFMQQISSTDTKKLITISGWLNELKDPELDKKIAEYLPSQIKFQGSILPSDVPSLVYLLSLKAVSLDISRNKEPALSSNSLNLGIKCFQEHGFSFFMESLELEKTKISSLDFSNNVIGDKGALLVASVLQNVDSLNLSGCGITTKGAKSIAKRLSNKRLSRLDLSGNIISKSGIDALSKCNIDQLVLTSYVIHEGKISKHDDVVIENHETDLMAKLVVNKSKSRIFNIDEFVVLEPNLPRSDVLAILSLCLQYFDQVNLRSSEISHDDLQELAYAIAILNKPIKSLDLSRTKIDDESALVISAAIHNIEKLKLEGCKLSNAAMQTLAKSIRELKQPIKSLDLSNNKVDDESARAISVAIHNIEKLGLRGCELSNAAMQTLAKSIRELKQPIKSLDLGSNEVDDESARAISAAIHNIEELVLNGCQLSNAAIQTLAKWIKRLKQPIKSLDLSENIVYGGSVRAISAAIHNIEKLGLRGCELSNAAIQMLARSIKILKQPIKLLNLSSNKVDYESARTISTAIHNIEELELKNCDLLNYAIQTMAKSIKIRKHPIKLLDLSGNKVDDESSRAISAAIHNIKELELCDCELSNDAVRILAKSTKELKDPLSTLDLTGNIIGKSGIDALPNCNIDKLILTSYVIHEDKISKHGDVVIGNHETDLMEKLVVNKFKSRTFHLKEFSVSESNLSTPGVVTILSLCLEHFEEVNLSSSNLTNRDLKKLTYAIVSLPKTISTLNLSNNDIGNKGALIVAYVLSNIDHLKLSGCGITTTGAQFIAAKLLHTKLSTLDLSNNDIGDGGALAVANILPNIESLELSGCGITTKGAQSIASKLLHTKISTLDITENIIGKLGIDALSNCNIDQLVLTSYVIEKGKISKHGDVVIGNHESDLMEKLVVNKIKSRTFSIKKFVVLKSNLSISDVVAILSLCLQHFDEVDLSSSEIPSDDLQELVYTIVLLDKPMKLLDLGWNKVDETSATSLTHCLHNIELLTIGDSWYISDKTKNILKSKLRELNLPEERVEFYDL